jgi:hypothetical protein
MLGELGATLDAHVEQCEDCSARVRGYQRIADMIAAAATMHEPPADWKQRTLARVRAARARRRRTTVLSMVGASAAASAALIFYMHMQGDAESPGPALAMEIVDRGGWRGDAHPGQEVHARAILAGEPHFEIRVYRGSRELLVRCPDAGPPVCLEADRTLLVWTVPTVGTYQVVFLVSQQPIVAPRGSFNDDTAAATAGGARVINVEPLNVH